MNKKIKKLFVVSSTALLLSGQLQIPSLVILGMADASTTSDSSSETPAESESTATSESSSSSEAPAESESTTTSESDASSETPTESESTTSSKSDASSETSAENVSTTASEPVASSSAGNTVQKSISPRAIFPNGDKVDFDNNGGGSNALVDAVTYFAARGNKAFPSGADASFESPNASGTGAVNTPIVQRITDGLKGKSVKLDYNNTSVSVEISFLTRTAVLSSSNNQPFDYYTDWMLGSAKSGSLNVKTPGVTGTYTMYPSTPGTTYSSRCVFTFTQTSADLKGTKIDFSFSPSVILTVDEYYRGAGGGVTSRNASYVFKDIPLSINRTGTDVVATANPQTIKYGNTSYNAKDFVTLKNQSGSTLNDLDVSFVTPPDTLTTPAKAKVKVSKSSLVIGEYDVPITYALGNTLYLEGSGTYSRFSLDDSLKNITATYNYTSGKAPINSNFSNQMYYKFDHYWNADITAGPLNNQKAHYSFSANGSDKLNKLDTFDGDRVLGVSKGDVVSIYHAEPAKLKNYANSAEQTVADKQENNLYEITTNGFKLLNLNRLKPSKQTVAQGISKADLDKNIASYLDASKFSTVKVDHFSVYPDTSKVGEQKGKIVVTETLASGTKAQYEYEVTFNVEAAIALTPVPQTVTYGQDSFDASKFVEIKDAQGKPVSNVNVEFVTAPDTLTTPAQAEVKVMSGQTELGRCKVDVTYEFGNSINLLGRSNDRVATFSLNDKATKITATYNYSTGGTLIHRDYSDVYYSLSHFGKQVITSGSLNTQTPSYTFSAKGTDTLNTLEQFDGDRILGVSSGDVIKIDHKEGGALLQNYVNNISEGNSPATEMLYEVTTKGFRTLLLNRLTPVDSVVLQGTSNAELDKNLSKYLPVTGNVKMVGFKAYPDTSKRGTSTGVITVKEDLSNSTSATWDYTVKFDVQKQLDVVAKNQVLKYGNSQSDYDAKNFVEVKDASGKVTTDFNAKFTSFPNGLNDKNPTATVEVTPKNDTLGEKYTVTVPVTYEFGNSINLLGLGDARVATFSLNDAVTKITATYDASKGTSQIHSSFSDTYYSLSYFDQQTLTSDALNTQTPYTFSANGTDTLNTLEQFDGDRILGVSSGDVIKVYHRESGHRFGNYMASNYQGDGKLKEVYFEIAKDGFHELNLNKLSPKIAKIKWSATQLEMDKVASQLVDVSAYKNLTVVGFTQYPDTSKTGEQAGKIKVEETLASGKKASYIYDVKLDVQPFDNTDPGSHEPKDPNMWLNVDVPLEMDFNSTEASQYQKIEGSVGKVENHSGRPVKVTVKSFTDEVGGKADMQGIDSLVLNGNALTSPLDLKNFPATPQPLIDLKSPYQDGQNVNLSGVSEVDLKISGTVISDLKASHHSTNKLELMFTPLDKDGNPTV